MAGPAHPEAMAPPKPGRTRTAPPQMPSSWWSSSRIRNYLLFDATGIIYFMVGFLALRMVWALGEGPESWNKVMEQLAHPLYIGFHVLALLSVIFVAVRFFSLFPKAQPRDTGLPMPPGAVIQGMLYVVWLAVTAAMSVILAGGIF
jgi:fumarate reductase subunit C